MAPIHREERLQMRQRGAASRKVNQIDFGLSFDPPVSYSRRKSQRVPHDTRPTPESHSHTSKTPASRSRLASAERSIRTYRSKSTYTSVDRPGLAAIEGQDVNVPKSTGTKRKRTNESSGAESAVKPTMPTRQKRRRTLRTSSVDPDNTFGAREVSTRADAGSSHLVDQENIEPDVQESDAVQEEDATLEQLGRQQRKRKKRKSIGQQRKKHRSSGDSTDYRTIPEGHSEEDGNEESDAEASGRDDSHELIMTSEQRIEEIEPQQGRALLENRSKRKKRKSIGQQRKKKRSSGGSSVSNQTSASTTALFEDNSGSLQRNSRRNGEDRVGAEDQNVSMIRERPPSQAQVHDQAAPTIQPKRRKRRSIGQQRKKRRSTDSLASNSTTRPTHIPPVQANDKDSSEDIHEEQAEEEGRDQQDSTDDETFVPPNRDDVDDVEESRFLEPRRQKQKKKPSRVGRQRNSPKKRERESNSGYPILTHRLTNISALPTITEEDNPSIGIGTGIETEPGEDPLTVTLTESFTTRPTPNAIDVLAQICQETVENVLEKIDHPSSTTTQTNTSPTTEASQKSKSLLRAQQRFALTSLSSRLSSQLLQHSQLLDQKTSLERRVRKAKKSRAETQAKWFAVRKRREEVALRSDEVRRKHWEGGREEEEMRRLGVGVGRVERGVATAVGMGIGGERDEGMDGLEFRVRDVVGKMGTENEEGGGGGGLLDKVREFNALLEQTAVALEAEGGKGK